MNNKILEDIKEYAVQALQREYGYCGIANIDDMVFINSGRDGENIKIKIEQGDE